MCAIDYDSMVTVFKGRTNDGRIVQVEHSVDIMKRGTFIQNGVIRACGRCASGCLAWPIITGEGMNFYS